MGDKSPKSKQRAKEQKTLAKNDAKRQSDQRQAQFSATPAEAKQKKK